MTPPAPPPVDAPAAARPGARRPPRAGWVGPLFRWELVRLARRGQDARARFILAASLLFVLTTFTLVWFGRADVSDLFLGTSRSVSLQESARFGEYFALSFVFAQLAVLVLLTPAYAAGAVSEEKEKRSFEYLLVTDLTSREVVVGKFLGRLTFLLGVLLAGLPVLCLTTLYGGISFRFLLGAYLITAATVGLHTAIGIAAAVATTTYRAALFRSYGLVVLHVVVGGVHPFFSPFAYLLFLENSQENAVAFWVLTGLYAAAELAGAVFALFLAVRWVRALRARPGHPRRRRRPGGPTPGPAAPRPPAGPAVIELGDGERIDLPAGELVPTARPLPVAVRTSPPAPGLGPKYPAPRPGRTRRYGAARRVVSDRPAVDPDDPFLWKERYITGAKRTADDDSIRGVLIALGVAVAAVVAFLGLIALVALAVGNAGFAGGLLTVVGAGALFLYLLTVGAAAAGAVVRERQRQTLESLLTVPVDRRAILWPKWRVAANRGWWWGLPAALVGPLALLASDAPLAAVPAAALVAAAVPFTASFALWLSVRCRTATRAILWTLPAVAGLTLVPVLAWKAASPEWAGRVTVAVGVTAAGTAAAAAVFWFLALASFERDGRK